MTDEFSAGGIVFRRKRTERAHSAYGCVEWLVAQHSQHNGWVFPKGLIGDHKENETHEETAVREVREETGIDARIIKKLAKPIRYFYTWKERKRRKTVYYYLMEYVGGDTRDHDWEMRAVEWLLTKDILDRLSYPSDKQAFRDALLLFDALPS